MHCVFIQAHATYGTVCQQPILILGAFIPITVKYAVSTRKTPGHNNTWEFCLLRYRIFYKLTER